MLGEGLGFAIQVLSEDEIVTMFFRPNVGDDGSHYAERFTFEGEDGGIRWLPPCSTQQAAVDVIKLLRDFHDVTVEKVWEDTRHFTEEMRKGYTVTAVFDECDLMLRSRGPRGPRGTDEYRRLMDLTKEKIQTYIADRKAAGDYATEEELAACLVV